MAILQQQIAEKFLARLAESKEVSAEKTEKLRLALTADKKLKAADYGKCRFHYFVAKISVFSVHFGPLNRDYGRSGVGFAQ
jgi:hypothetical protein